MGDRILVSALTMKNKLKNKIGEIEKLSDSGQEAASYERIQKKELRNHPVG